jgi:adenine phosphoribosyltransferase
VIQGQLVRKCVCYKLSLQGRRTLSQTECRHILYSQTGEVTELSSELHVIKERMSRVESLLSRMVPPEESESPDTAGGDLTCMTCGTRLTHSESRSALRDCRNCRTQTVSGLMRPRQQLTSSSPAQHGSNNHHRVEKIREALDVIELLALAKQYYTYSDLEHLLGLPSTVLSRYVKGHVLPTGKRGGEIRRSLLEAVKLGSHVTETLTKHGIESISQVNTNPRLLWFIVQHIVYLNAGRRITKVLTATEQGVSLATLVSYRLGVPLIVATPQKRAGTMRTIEIELSSGAQPSVDAYVRSVHVPNDALKGSDAVLIVTDFLSDGSLQVALEKLARAARANVAAIWATTVTADSWLKTECPIDSFNRLASPANEASAGEPLTRAVGKKAIVASASPA